MADGQTQSKRRKAVPENHIAFYQIGAGRAHEIYWDDNLQGVADATEMSSDSLQIPIVLLAARLFGYRTRPDYHIAALNKDVDLENKSHLDPFRRGHGDSMVPAVDLQAYTDFLFRWIQNGVLHDTEWDILFHRIDYPLQTKEDVQRFNDLGHALKKLYATEIAADETVTIDGEDWVITKGTPYSTVFKAMIRCLLKISKKTEEQMLFLFVATAMTSTFLSAPGAPLAHYFRAFRDRVEQLKP